MNTPNLIQLFQHTRKLSEDLIASLSAEDCQAQSMPDASPAKWHLAHTTWFFETLVLRQYEDNFKPWNEAFQILFNSYYNAIGDKHPRPSRGLLTRPYLEEVILWRHNINRRIESLLSNNTSQELSWLIELGIAHEQQHQELVLTDIHHLLSCSALYPRYRSLESSLLQQPSFPNKIENIVWLAGPTGLQQFGFDPAKTEFHFDNEAPRHTTFLQPFALANRLTINSEWQEFIAAGGYQDHRWWLDAGWAWVNQENIASPLYWNTVLGQAHLFTLNGNEPLDPLAPVSHISYFEADAYARWKNATDAQYFGARLPSEAEWEVFVANTFNQIPEEANLLESGLLQTGRTENHGQPIQFFGDAWEWTASNYSAYPGYQSWPGVAGEYNGKFMVNQMVLKGGSCFTPRSHIRKTYRNFFPTHARWQMTGLRLAKSLTTDL